MRKYFRRSLSPRVTGSIPTGGKLFAEFILLSLPDPGVSWGDTNSQSGCANLFFCIFSAVNCMKMKEVFDPEVGHAFGVPWMGQ